MITRVRQFIAQDAGLALLGVLFVLSMIVALPRVYATDEVQYYAWVRSLWFDHDVDFANEYQTFAKLNPHSGIAESLLQSNRIRERTGLYGNIAPVGSAILWAPWFIAADVVLHVVHWLGLARDIAADGYSWPYQRAISYASAIYAGIGLLIVRRLSQLWSSRWSSTLATVSLWLATPLVFYMTIQMPFAHANGFFMTACFVWCWWQMSQPNPHLRWWVLLGVSGGGMFLVREQLILFAVLPALSVGRHLWQRLQARQWPDWQRDMRNWGLAGVMVLVMLVPQFAAYWALNGTPLPASEVSGKLNLCSPHALDTLIDFDPRPAAICNVGVEPVTVPAWSRGALVWSPILGLALVGLVWLAWQQPFIGGAMLLAIAVQVWINGAFGTTWHLSGAFGFRRFIECTPFFAVGLAFLLDRMRQRVPQAVVIGVCVALIGWNMGLIANATLFNNETHLRTGLSWPDVWRWQWELPGRIWHKGSELFDRCRLIKNSCS